MEAGGLTLAGAELGVGVVAAAPVVQGLGGSAESAPLEALVALQPMRLGLSALHCRVVPEVPDAFPPAARLELAALPVDLQNAPSEKPKQQSH